jgi:hypothetical protein
MDCMKVGSPSTVFEVFRPFNCVLRCFGLSTLSFTGQPADGNIVVRPFDLIIFLVILCGHFLLFGLLFYRPVSDVSASFVLNKGYSGIITFDILISIIIIIYQFCKRESTKKILMDLHSFDLKVSLDLLHNLMWNKPFIFRYRLSTKR